MYKEHEATLQPEVAMDCPNLYHFIWSSKKWKLALPMNVSYSIVFSYIGGKKSQKISNLGDMGGGESTIITMVGTH
ncbi:unnamed protein product [Prunus armeniaca]